MKSFQPPKLPLTEVQWEPLIPFIGRANRSLSRYDGVLYGVPNPEVLLSPLTTEEAVLSSKIEGTQATLSEVFKFEAGEEPMEESRRLDIQEIINYRNAMHHAEEALKSRPFNLNLLLELHSIILDSVRGRNKARGQFRTIQNWIGPAGSSIENAEFVPPAPEFLMDHLSNWEKYYHEERPDPLVQIAIIHAQFEIIHPFLDGNGRIGRMLIPLFLYEKKMLSRPMFYLSTYLEGHRDEYVARLRALGQDDGAWNEWIVFFLSAIDKQADENASKARAIMELYRKLKERTLALTRSEFAVPLLDQMFKLPRFQSSQLKFSADLTPSRQAISHILRILRDAGILKVVREGSGRRGQVFALAELLNLCEGKEVF